MKCQVLSRRSRRNSFIHFCTHLIKFLKIFICNNQHCIITDCIFTTGQRILIQPFFHCKFCLINSNWIFLHSWRIPCKNFTIIEICRNSCKSFIFCLIQKRKYQYWIRISNSICWFYQNLITVFAAYDIQIDFLHRLFYRNFIIRNSFFKSLYCGLTFFFAYAGNRHINIIRIAIQHNIIHSEINGNCHGNHKQNTCT